jgi:hypothetical protein
MRAVIEFLAIGGITLFLFPLSWMARHTFALDSCELAVGFLAFYGAYVINDPHFTVTYVLFYKDIKQRALAPTVPRLQRFRFLIAGFVVPALLIAWSITAIKRHDANMLGWMIQLMFLTVGWHYAKQGFGVLAVLSARKGIRITPIERRALLFHCYAGWAFAWSNPSMPRGEFEEKGVVYTQIAHPRWLELTTGSIFALSTIVLAIVLASRWKREGKTLPLAPLTGLLITVWSWTIFSASDPLLRYVIPALHSIQYFYFVWLMKKTEASAEEGPPTFGRPVAVRLGVLALTALALGWLLFHGLPEFFDTAFVTKKEKLADLGPTPYFAAFFVIVNIHHYFMDTVIWRRENPDTRWMMLEVVDDSWDR